MIPQPFRPNDDDQPTQRTSRQTLRPAGYGQRARPTQRPALAIEDMPTAPMPPAEWIALMRQQRLTRIFYHREQAAKLRQEATEIGDNIADMIATGNRLDARYRQLRGWTNLTRREAEEMLGLGTQLPLIRRDIALYRVAWERRIERATGHDAAIRQLQAEG